MVQSKVTKLDKSLIYVLNELNYTLELVRIRENQKRNNNSIIKKIMASVQIKQLGLTKDSFIVNIMTFYHIFLLKVFYLLRRARV